MDLKAAHKRAGDLLALVDAAREKATVAGMPVAQVNDLGLLTEQVATDAQEMARELLLHYERSDLFAQMRGHVAGMNALFAAYDGTPPMEEAASPAPAATHEALTANPERQPALPGVDPTPPEQHGDTTPHHATPKARAVEKEIPLDTYELSGADYRALPYPRAAIDGQLAAFRAEYAGKTGKRPRVTLAAFLRTRLGDPTPGDASRPA